MVAVGIILGVVLIFGVLILAISADNKPFDFCEPTQKDNRDMFKGFIDDEHF